MEQRPAFAKALVTLEHHPVLFIMGFRFLYGLRTISPIAIGTSHIRSQTFFLLNALAAIVWAVLFTGVGYGFGGGIERLLDKSLSAGRLLPIAVLVIVVPLPLTAMDGDSLIRETMRLRLDARLSFARD